MKLTMRLYSSRSALASLSRAFHSKADALMCPYRIGEWVRAKKVVVLQKIRDILDVTGENAKFFQQDTTCSGYRNFCNTTVLTLYLLGVGWAIYPQCAVRANCT